MSSDLKVQCKVCREGFRVPNQVDEATFHAMSPPIDTQAYQCSKCGQKRFYEVGDHFFG